PPYSLHLLRPIGPLDGVGVVAQIIQAVQVQAGARDGVGALAGTARDGVGALAGTAQDGVGVRAPTIQVVQVQSPVRDGVGVGVRASTNQVVQVQVQDGVGVGAGVL
uniref:Uncharacterized protein n=1 Tax=Brassica oleracea var. oleracea TaxID=109376 RepID=A0A0D2ZYE7_BRAOL